ncbi:MAG: hypothetical protein IKU93_02775 [Alistipes sp.]|nr:hypothetical protein [Alistipes sp.]
MRQNGKVSSKAEKNSNRAAQKFYHYGKAMLFGYFEITKRFACGQDAIEWHRRVQSGWRAKIYDAHLYYDSYATQPMIKGFDSFRFAKTKKICGMQTAIQLAKEGAFI